MFNYNDRANNQRFLGSSYQAVTLSKPEVPMWVSGSVKSTSNIVYTQKTKNPISNAIGVDTVTSYVNEPNGTTRTVYEAVQKPITGGGSIEYISATNSHRADKMASIASSMPNQLYLE
jgi:hypothetical protein